MQAVAQHQNEADGVLSREVAAARYAASGNLTTAVKQMVNASDSYLRRQERAEPGRAVGWR